MNKRTNFTNPPLSFLKYRCFAEYFWVRDGSNDTLHRTDGRSRLLHPHLHLDTSEYYCQLSFSLHLRTQTTTTERRMTHIDFQYDHLHLSVHLAGPHQPPCVTEYWVLPDCSRTWPPPCSQSGLWTPAARGNRRLYLERSDIRLGSGGAEGPGGRQG